MGPVRPRRPSLPGAPSAPLGPGSPWVRKMMVGYRGRSLPGVHPPRLPWFFTPQEGLGPSSSSSRAGGQSWAQLVHRDCPQGPHCWGQRWHRASLPRGAAAPPWLTGAHPAPRGRCGETGGARSRAASGFWGHALCHPWRLAGRQHRVLRAFPADRGDPDPRGHREHQHRPGQERHRKWLLVKPCVPVTAPSPLQKRPRHSHIPITAPSPSQKHPSPFTAARSRSPGTCPSQRGEAKPTPPTVYILPSRALSGYSPRHLDPDTHLSTIVTGSTVSTTRTLGTGGALDAAFTGETSLALEGAGKPRPSGGWGLRGARTSWASNGGQLTLAPAGPGAPASPGTPCRRGVQSQRGRAGGPQRLGVHRDHPNSPSPAGRRVMRRDRDSPALWSHPHTHLLAGLASLAGGASGARQTLGEEQEP